jgi:5-(carboxyamino)imidazole ribonucleotide synthase
MSEPAPTTPTNPAPADLDALAPGSDEPRFGAPAEAGELGTLAGYRVQKLLGKGGMGAVYLALDAELSVLVARRPSGEVAVHPPSLNHHEDRVLAWSVLPAPMPAAVLDEARALATRIADAIGLEGILAVELFRVGGSLLVNELAPRPHNSFHATEVACLTSQFEQLVRAACDLPLGATDVTRPAAIANLLGDLWESGAPRFERALAVPGVRLFLYGKKDARPGRKMGHLLASGATPDDAVARVREALAALSPAVTPAAAGPASRA